ncbi:HD domain-containing protein [Kribbella sp. NPDC002412]
MRRFLTAPGGFVQLRRSQLGLWVATQVSEYEAAETIEARCAKDADRLECLLQAVEYGEAGYKRVGGWIESSRARIQTAFGRRLAEAALQTSPLAWRDR